MASSFWETHQLRWGASPPPTTIYGFPGGKRQCGSTKSGFEFNFAICWVAARGPPTTTNVGDLVGSPRATDARSYMPKASLCAESAGSIKWHNNRWVRDGRGRLARGVNHPSPLPPSSGPLVLQSGGAQRSCGSYIKRSWAGYRRLWRSRRPFLPKALGKRLGGEAPHLFLLVFGRGGTASTPQIDDLRPHILKIRSKGSFGDRFRRARLHRVLRSARVGEQNQKQKTQQQKPGCSRAARRPRIRWARAAAWAADRRQSAGCGREPRWGAY
jgi:hypothetical protein